jgi:hypothetical protein
MAEGNTAQEADNADNLGGIKLSEENIPELIKPPQTDRDFAKPEEDKGPTRQRIVYALLFIMVGLISLPFLMTVLQMAICVKDAAKECKDVMTKELWEFVHIAFPALTGLLGTAIGFYFERNSR